MVKVRVSTGMELEYEAFGNPAHPALLLVMGLGGSLSLWRLSFVRRLTDLGYFVIRFDNRDVGLSTHLDDDGPAPVRSFMCKAACSLLCGACCFPSACCGAKNACCLRPNYNLADMADDAVGLLDALGIQRAVIFGGSMGGMISQFILLNHTDRVQAVVLAFTAGKFPLPDSSIRGPIMARIPAGLSNEQLLEETMVKQDLLAGAARNMRGRGREQDFEYHKELYAPALARRDYYAEAGGKGRQTEAIVCSPRRYALLRKLFRRRAAAGGGASAQLLNGENAAAAAGLPQVAIFHGEEDLMVPTEEGRLLHAAIPGSTLLEIPGMGHEVHPVHFDEVVGLVEGLHCHAGAKHAGPPAGDKAAEAAAATAAAADAKSKAE